MPTTNTQTLPNPAYGLADETRLTILRDAQELGIKAAAELHRVTAASIYVWRKRYAAVQAQETV